MRNLKKILALVLALVMSLSLMATAGAASFPDVADDNAYKTAIEVLNGVEVLQGYDNGARFEPKGAITRAEAAAVIYRIATGDVNDTQKDIYTAWNGAGKLSDVSGWYAGYVNYCCNAGYIKGYPNGTFQAQNNVTGYEVLAMVLRAMGYGRNGEFSGSQWAITVGSLAQTLGITKNITETLGEPATREMVAEIVFRAIFCETQKYNALHLYEGTGTNLARENLSLEEVEGVVIANEYAHLEGSKTLADGKTLIRDEKNEKDYTINQVTTLDDMGESRMIYIQNKTNVISLADSGKNAKAESTDAEKVSAVLDRAGISEGDAEKFLNFDKAFKRDSDYKLKYVLKTDNGKIGTLTPAQVVTRINDAAGDKRAKTVGGNSVETTIQPGWDITDVDTEYMRSIFAKADLTSAGDADTIIDGEIYVGTQSTNDISDVKPDQKYSYESFYEEFIKDTENDQAFTANDNGNWVKVIDNDADGVADYIFKVIYTMAQVTRVKDDKITLDTEDHTLAEDDGTICGIDALNNLTDEKVVSADTLELDDIVYYAVIENKAQTYKAAMETATFKDVSRNGQTAVTTDDVEWTQSDVCEHIEDEAFAHNVRGLAGKVSYDCYFDRGGYLAAYVKTDKVGDFKLITDGWFNALKNRNDEYAVNAYNDAESKLEVIDITKYGDLFIASASVLNNGWNGLKFLGLTDGGKEDTDSSVTNTVAGDPAALNGGATAGETNDKIHTTVAAITADGTILPVHDASVTGRYDHEMIDLYKPGNVNNINDGKAVIPTMAAVEGTIYRTSNGSDTAYDSERNDVQVRALSSTIYYVVWGSNANAKVLSFTGYDNAPNMKKLADRVEDVYCVGTKRAADNDTDKVTYSADVVVIELNKPYPDDKEPFFVVDNDWRRTEVGDYRVDGIDKNGEKIEDMRVTDYNSVLPFAYNGNGIANDKQIYPGLYWRTEVGEKTYKLVAMSPADIAANFSVGTVVEESWTNESYIVMQSWNKDTVYGIGPKGWDEDNDAQAVLDTSTEKQYKITGASLYTLAYGGDDYDECAASLNKADLKDVVDRQVDDYVVEGYNLKNELDRDTWYVQGNNVHYYNRNKILVFHNDSNNAVWAVSFANVVDDDGNNYADQDYAWDVWQDIRSEVPANIYTGNAITVKGDVYDGTTWSDAATNDVAITDTLGVSDVVNNVAYAKDEDGITLTLTAPVGKVFYENAGAYALKETANAALIHSYSFNADKTELKVTLQDITDDVTLTFGLKADDAGVNKPQISITDTKLVTDPTFVTYNVDLDTASTITFKKKAANGVDPAIALAANEKVDVTKVTVGDLVLTEGAAPNGYDVAADGHSITLYGTAHVTGNIVIEGKLTEVTERTITLKAAARENALGLTGDAITKFTINNAMVGTEPVLPDGKTEYPVEDVSEVTYTIGLDETLTVYLANANGYAYSDVVTIETATSGATNTSFVAIADVIYIDSPARYENADNAAACAPKISDDPDAAAMTGAGTIEEALSNVNELEGDPVWAGEDGKYEGELVETTEDGTKVYKVIAQNKEVTYYAVKAPEAPVTPPSIDDTIDGVTNTPVESGDLGSEDIATYDTTDALTALKVDSADKLEVKAAQTVKITSADVLDAENAFTFTKATAEDEVLVATDVTDDDNIDSITIVETPADDAGDAVALSATKSWTVTVTLSDAAVASFPAEGVEFNLAVVAAKSQEQGPAAPTFTGLNTNFTDNEDWAADKATPTTYTCTVTAKNGWTLDEAGFSVTGVEISKAAGSGAGETVYTFTVAEAATAKVTKITVSPVPPTASAIAITSADKDNVTIAESATEVTLTDGAGTINITVGSNATWTEVPESSPKKYSTSFTISLGNGCYASTKTAGWEVTGDTTAGWTFTCTVESEAAPSEEKVVAVAVSATAPNPGV